MEASLLENTPEASSSIIHHSYSESSQISLTSLSQFLLRVIALIAPRYSRPTTMYFAFINLFKETKHVHLWKVKVMIPL